MLGKRIRQIRNARKMPARVLAEQVGVHIQHIYDIERGRYRPSLETARKIAQTLGVPLAELFLDDEVGRNTLLAEYLQRLPSSVQDFLTREEAAPYLEVVKELADTGLSPEDVKDVGAAAVRLLERHRK